MSNINNLSNRSLSIRLLFVLRPPLQFSCTMPSPLPIPHSSPNNRQLWDWLVTLLFIRRVRITCDFPYIYALSIDVSFTIHIHETCTSSLTAYGRKRVGRQRGLLHWCSASKWLKPNDACLVGRFLRVVHIYIYIYIQELVLNVFTTVLRLNREQHAIDGPAFVHITPPQNTRHSTRRLLQIVKKNQTTRV